MSTTVIENTTCLGCGCTCDDIAVTVTDNRIAATKNACDLGVRWFGDGTTPAISRVAGQVTTVDAAIQAAATLLVDADRPFVLLAPGLSCEAQRAAVSIADLLRARLDTATSTAASAILAAQERGYASSTLGEIRNRADVVVYWAIDVASRYPRFEERYAPANGGVTSRSTIAVDVGGARADVRASHRISVEPQDEIATLVAMRAIAQRGGIESYRDEHGNGWRNALALAPALLAAHYVGLIFDAEPDDRAERSELRFDALFALTHALNERTRCAGIAMRGGGNRSGADSVLTAQTGYPMAVDFAGGVPRYDPYDGSAIASLTRDAVVLALVLGDASLLPPELADRVANARTIAIGRRASNSPLGASDIAIDTGVAGIHSAGAAVRADDVPLPLRQLVPGAGSAESVLVSLSHAVNGALRATTTSVR